MNSLLYYFFWHTNFSSTQLFLILLLFPIYKLRFDLRYCLQLISCHLFFIYEFYILPQLLLSSDILHK